MAKLTAKQKRFCEEYLIDLNGTQSAIRAGYSEKTACAIGTENLRKPLISSYIAQLMAERNKETKIDAAWVLTASVNLYNRCMIKGDGFNAAGSGKALDLIGKHVDVKAFEERLIVKQANLTPIPIKVVDAS